MGLFTWLRRLLEAKVEEPAPGGYSPETSTANDLRDLVGTLGWDALLRLLPAHKYDLHYPSQLLRSSDQVPGSPGLYAWYFDGFPDVPDGLPGIPKTNCYLVEHWRLMYIGTAPRNECSSGDLRKRICWQHLGKSAAASTLRFSLAFLLQEELNLEIRRRRPGGKSWWLGAEGEQLLTEWMCDHARVVWSPVSRPWDHEGKMVAVLGSELPLNIRGNAGNPFAVRLKRERTKWRKRYLDTE